MRLLTAILAWVCLATAAHALTPDQKKGAGNSTFTTTAPVAASSAFFTDNNNTGSQTTAQSVILAVPQNNTANFALPFSIPPKPAASGSCTNATTCMCVHWSPHASLTSSTACSSVIAFKFKVPNNAAWQQTSSSNRIGLFGRCSAGACTGGDAAFWLSSPFFSATQANNIEFNLVGHPTTGTVTNSMWTGPASCTNGGTTGTTHTCTGNLLYQNTNYCGILVFWGGEGIGGSDGTEALIIEDTSGNMITGGQINSTNAQNDVVNGNNFYYTTTQYRDSTHGAAAGMIQWLGALHNQSGSNVTGGSVTLADVGQWFGTIKNSSGTIDATVAANYCNGTTDPITWAKTAGVSGDALVGNVLYRLNDVGTYADSYNSNPLTVVSTGNIPIVAAPLTKSDAFTLNEIQPGYVFSIYNSTTPGTATTAGDVYVSGAYNSTDLGGAPSGVKCEIIEGPASTHSPGAIVAGPVKVSGPPTGGVWSGVIHNVPETLIATYGSGFSYQRVCWPTNVPSYKVTGYNQFGVGIVALRIGGRGINVEDNTYAAVNLDGYTVPSGVYISGVVPNGFDAGVGNYTSNQPGPYGSHYGVQIFTNQTTTVDGNIIGGANCGAPPCLATREGDGALAADILLAQTYGVPVMGVYWSRGGTVFEGIVMDGLSGSTTTSSGSGSGPYAVAAFGTNGNTQQTNPAVPTGASGWPANSYIFESIKVGSLQVYDGANDLIATDLTNSCANTTAPCTGVFHSVGGAPVSVTAGGTITYNPATSTVAPSFTGLTFSGTPPTSCCTVKWVAIHDLSALGASGTFTRQGQYGAAGACGYWTCYGQSVLNNLLGPPTFIRMEQSDQSYLDLRQFPPASTIAGDTNYNDHFKAYQYIVDTLIAGQYSWYSTSIPKLVGNTPRNTAQAEGTPGSTVGAWSGWPGTEQWGQNAGNGTYPNYIYGGSAWDVSESTTPPHPGPALPGSGRNGRHHGMAEVYAVEDYNDYNEEPYISAAAFTTSTTYNAACSVAGTCVDVTITLQAPGATAVETCGSGFSVTSGCTFTGFGSTPTIIGISIGNSSDQYDSYGDESWNTATPTGDNQQMTCKLYTATLVECVKTTGTWTVGSTYLRYDNNFSRQFTVKSITNGTSGSWSGSSPQDITATGCSGTGLVAPVITITRSGTTLSAVRKVRGYCPSGSPSFTNGTYSGGSGSFTGNLATLADDIADMGTAMYDNIHTLGSSGDTTVGSEPGNLVRQLHIAIGPF
jgi:hypothetical protein